MNTPPPPPSPAGSAAARAEGRRRAAGAFEDTAPPDDFVEPDDEAVVPENCYEGYASDRLNGWLNDACVGGGPTPYPGVKEGPKQPCDLGLVRELVSRGASPRLTGALHTAAANDQAACCELLLELAAGEAVHGARVDDVDESGSTALHVCAVVKAVAAMEVLLSHGANTDALNDLAQTPRMAAIRERELTDEWCAALDITLPDDLVRKNEVDYPKILALLPDVPPPTPPPVKLPPAASAPKDGKPSQFWWLNKDEHGRITTPMPPDEESPDTYDDASWFGGAERPPIPRAPAVPPSEAARKVAARGKAAREAKRGRAEAKRERQEGASKAAPRDDAKSDAKAGT